MMKKLEAFVLLFFSVELLFSQEHFKFSAWANAGLGISSFDRSVPSWSMAGNLGLAIQLSKFILKYKRSGHSEFVVFAPQEEASSQEILFGYLVVPISENKIEEFNPFRFSAHAGVGSLEQITRGKRIINPGFFDDTYEMIEQSSTCYPVELEMKFLFSHYIGISYSGFLIISKFTPIFGGQLNILVGYL